MDHLGQWVPLTVRETVELFAAAPFRWWIGAAMPSNSLLGGRGGVTTTSMSVSVGPTVADLPTVLHGWDLHVASSGTLSPWHGEPLQAELNQNNIWCRRSPSSAWSIDVTIGEGSGSEWVYWRDPSLRLDWDEAVLHSNGVPYLAPDLQLLFKSKSVRPKDDEDAKQVIGSLSSHRPARLTRWLPEGHPWRQYLANQG